MKNYSLFLGLLLANCSVVLAENSVTEDAKTETDKITAIAPVSAPEATDKKEAILIEEKKQDAKAKVSPEAPETSTEVTSEVSKTSIEAPKKVEAESPVPQIGKVTRRLNVRIRPSLEHEIVAILEPKTEVTIVSQNIKDWYEILLPTNGDVWVYKDDISPNGKVLIEKCGLRSGAGVIFNPYSKTLSEGEMVTVLKEENGWYKITPPENYLTAWVAAQYVELPQPVTEEPKKEEVAKEEPIADKQPDIKEDKEAKPTIVTKEKIEESTKEEPKKEEVAKEEPVKQEVKKEEEKTTPPQVEKKKKPAIRSIQAGTGRAVWRGYIYRLATPRGEATHQLVIHFSNGKKARVGFLCSNHAHIFLSDWYGWPVIVYGTVSKDAANPKEGYLKVSGIQIEEDLTK